MLGLEGSDKNERGPLEPVECPLIKDVWKRTGHDLNDVETTFGKSIPTAQPGDRPSAAQPADRPSAG